MTYYGGKELAAAFRTVREQHDQDRGGNSGEQVRLQAGARLSQRSRRRWRTSRSAPGFPFHIHSNKITDMKQVNFTELMQKVSAEEAKPRTKAEIIAFLKSEGDKFASFLEGLPESFLAETGHDAARRRAADEDPLRDAARSAKEHEMHHRGQLMTMQRMIGQVPHLTRQMQERMAQMQAAARRRRRASTR